MRWKPTLPQRLTASVPLWIVYLAVFAALVASHATLLRLPYYWDEAGYYIPAAWDFFRTGSLIPITTLTNAHPPLPSVLLAVGWKLFGFCPLVTRLEVLAVAALGLTAVWRLAMQLIAVPAVALWTVVLTALYPVWFAQSSLAHADIFAAACTLWGLVFALPAEARRQWAAAACFAAAALSKETAIVIPLTLALISATEAIFARPLRWRLIREAAVLTSCLLPLALWYGWHWHKTGFLFGNPEFLRYNAQANLEPLRILAAFGHRLLHLTAHMNLFVPVLLALQLSVVSSQWSVKRWAAGKSFPVKGTGVSPYIKQTESKRALAPEGKSTAGRNLHLGIPPFALRRIFALILANALFFSVLGGALLTRYLLPIYPLILLLAVATFYRRSHWWHWLAGLSAAAFLAGLFVNPPYGFAPEDNLAYAQVIRLHQAGIDELNRHFPAATVLSAWPMTDELTRPELGYLQQPYEVYRLEDFTAAEIARAANEPGQYSAALVFSTKYDPQSQIFTLGPKSKAMDERYFGLHHDLPPEAIASALGGRLVWKRQDQGQWVALIRFRQTEAE